MSQLKPPVSEGDHRLGSEQALVTLVEYGDYECPHCARAQPIVAEVRKRMGARLALVFRHFPLSNAHPHAQLAAEAAEGAASQGKFWEMHESLFAHQEALEAEDLVQRARRLDLDVARFEQELAAGTHASRVRHDFSSGVRSGVNGTPTFFINGIRHDDAWDTATLIGALTAASHPPR
jgi:protein-disulfide isomerase